ncbi:MAG: hypothetical protein HYT76_00240 [Deltaproteobacteria bacterium]|nr:hypothetical protein [Deltaproteobacteria bacterium]
MDLRGVLFWLLGGLVSIVCCPPTLVAGPSKQIGQVLPKTCAGLQKGIVDHCCDNFKGKKVQKTSTTANPLQNEVRVRNITVTDCLGGHYKVKCVDQHGNDLTHLPHDKRNKKKFTKTKLKGSSDPTCLVYEKEFTKRGCEKKIPEIVCPAEVTSESVTIANIPTCQEVQNRARITCPKLPEINTEALDTSVSLEPTAGSSATPFSTDDNPENTYTGEIPSVFTNIPEEDRHQVLDVLRFELPANSLRYWIARSAFRVAVQQLPDAAVLGGALEGALSCDTDQLFCEIRPLGLIDLDEALSASLSELESDTEYRDDMREFRITGLSYSEDWIDIDWTGWISITSTGDWGFDLKNQARFNFLPTHFPENGYETSTENNPLATTQMINGLPWSLCSATAALAENGQYYGYKKPFSTTCNSTTNQYKNFGILDEFPRPIDPLPLSEHIEESEEAGGNPFSFATRCYDMPWASIVAAGPSGAMPLMDNADLTFPVTNATGTLTEPEFTSLRTSTAQFGCAGQEYAFRSDLPGLAYLPIESDFIELGLALEHYVVSAAGTDFAATLKLGGFEANIHPGVLNIEFRVLVEISEWIEENVWGGWLIGWALRWVERIFSGLVTIMANGFNMTILWSLPSTYEIEANDITANIHGVIRQIPYLDDGITEEARQEGIAIGTRRLVTSTPSVTRPAISSSWYFDECSESYTALGEGRFIDALLSLLGGCLFEQAANLIRYVTSPIVTVFIDFADWLFDFMNAIQGAINQTLITNVDRIQEQNDFAGLIQTSVEQSYYQSSYLTEEVVPPDAESIVNRLPYPYSQACTIAGPESGACEIMELMLGGPLVARHSSRLEINRIGAKTHYRSYSDFTDYLESGEELDFNFPPVRFCTGGDNPPADESVYPFTKAEIDSFSTFEEIKIDTPGNWQNQCAYFIDVKPQFCIAVDNPTPVPTPTEESYGLFFAPTLQTVLLVNEIFFCPENSWCNIRLPNLRRRAEAAACSVLADTWYHQIVLPGDATTPSDVNLLQSLTGSDSSARTTVEEVLGRAGYSDEEIERMIGFASSCRTVFEEAGGTIPTAPERNPCQPPAEEGGSP